ncbi:hypothetical protein O3G_MSEX001304 [Manduca sexta]|uniref:THAP-type domain-containing protein n=2 Tax=Manduca sexta TaxID=7130 RepID=A0A922CCH2_MANSE|nr:hypothetical protein O3G_MSEX001304 [Manduca sexta]
MASKSYRICAVPLCHNTCIKTPSKLFIHVPQSQNLRVKWLQLARRDPTSVSPKSSIYFCEDHFDLPNDMENYMEYSIMGSVSAIRMKPSCLPSRFECQPDRLKRTAKSVPRPVAVKRQRASLIQEILVQTETVDTPSTSNIGTGDSQVMDEKSDLFEMNQNKSTQVCPESENKIVQVNFKPKYRSKGLQTTSFSKHKTTSTADSDDQNKKNLESELTVIRQEKREEFHQSSLASTLKLIQDKPRMSVLIHEKIWLDKNIYNDAEKAYYENLSKVQASPQLSLACSSLASEVAKARQHIKNSLECMDSVATLAGVPNTELNNKLNSLEKENKDLKKAIDDLRNLVISLKARVDILESADKSKVSAKESAPAAAPAEAKNDEADDDDDVDLFGSDDEAESAEAAKVREERLAAYNAKKAKKPVLIAKSNIILDVKPWDDETDMAALEQSVRTISTDGLLWGAAKLVPLAYGIHKLQISCVVEDDKVSVDWLTEEIEKFEDFVQSVDIAAFNKV